MFLFRVKKANLGLISFAVLCTAVYRTPSHKYIKMTVTKTYATISLMQPNDVSLGCKVFKFPFRMAYQFGGSQASPYDQTENAPYFERLLAWLL